MKADSYLNLCVEQAHLSPLHYRHGCVVVKGGKVIGQGFNDYRPGYDGGSVLKTGVLPKAAVFLDRNAIAKSKPDKRKSKSKSRSNQREETPTSNAKSKFKPVEALSGNCGGGHHANARLSMHSEMMAINSALTSSSTLAASTVSCVKPCFKLPGDSKRKRESRKRTLTAYVRAVCLNAATGAEAQQQVQRSGKAKADEWCVRPSTARCDDVLSQLYAAGWSSVSSLPERKERRGQRVPRSVQEQQWVPVQQVQVV